jgi:hypothetical protein
MYAPPYDSFPAMGCKPLTGQFPNALRKIIEPGGGAVNHAVRRGREKAKNILHAEGI